MKRYGYGTRLLSLILAMVMLFSMVPLLQLDAMAAETVTSVGHGMSITQANKITMPIKIMDYESDGMLFDYLFGKYAGGKDGPEDYEPESNYWIDFTGTISTGTAVGNNIKRGSGISTVHLASLAQDRTWNNLKMDLSTRNVGGKQMLQVIRDMPNSSTRLMWNMAKFSSEVKVSQIRYAVVTFIDFNRNAKSEAPKIGISSRLDDDESVRYSTGNFSNWYYLNPNTVGHWGVEYAVIDLHDGGSGNGMALSKTVTDLYLDFPMGPNDNQEFCIAGIGFFPNKGDAEQFGVWSCSVGSMSDTDTATYVGTGGSLVTIPADSYDNNNRGFSFLVNTTSTFGNVPSISDYLATRVSAGQ